jgi:hypothetical protein
MRTKTKQILFKVDADEYALIRERMAKCGIINMSRFIRVLACQGYIFHINLASVNECAVLLGRISGSVNQIAKRVNGTGNFYPEDDTNIKSMFDEIMTQFKEVLHELVKIYEAADTLRKKQPSGVRLKTKA